MSKYFFTQMPVFGQWGPKTERDNNQQNRITRLHFLLDLAPTAVLSSSSPYLILVEELAQELAGCTGLAIHEGIFEPSENFREMRSSIQLPKLRWAEVLGVPHKDDFGMERSTRLIVSEKVKKIIEERPHEGVNFMEGSAPPDDEIKRRLFDEAKKFAEEMKAKKPNLGSSSGWHVPPKS